MSAALSRADAGSQIIEVGSIGLQQFTYDSDGALAVSGTDLCITVSPDAGQPTGGPSHLRRDLLLQPCDSVEPALSRWLFPGPSPE